jgi:hypothetical protein
MNYANELLTLALKLPPAERAYVAHELLLTLDSEEECSGTEYEAAWNRELGARMQQVDAGTAGLSDWRDAIERIRKAIARGPAA